MAEKIIWIAKCKLRGMNQRVGVVYDDETLNILSLRSFGRGVGTLRVETLIGTDRQVINERLAHKADNFDLLDFKTERAKVVPVVEGKGAFTLPDNFQVSLRWDF